MQDRKPKRVLPPKWPRAVDVLFFLGCGLVSVGAGLWLCFPAGLVAAGLFCLVGSFLSERTGGEDGEDKA